jgi:hypothetical protein
VRLIEGDRADSFDTIMSNRAEAEVGRKFWNVEELSGYLAVPAGWIYDRTQANGPEIIPHIKLGKYIRFDPESEAFRGWLAEHEVRSEIDKGGS